MQKLTKTLVIMGLMMPFSVGALGIGDIRLHSALNQRLNAEVALIVGADESAEDVRASLASPAAFAQAGIERPFFLNSLRFEVVEHGKGRAPTIKITSADTIREPFLSFLIELQWPQGRVSREFTLLLDPPSAFKDPPALVPNAAPPVKSPAPAVAPSAATAAVAAVAVDGAHASPGRLHGTTYGPVRSGETLWSIAKVIIQTQRITPEQMVKALYEANPQAFAKPNINAIQPGATLRVPDNKVVLRHSAVAAKKFFDQHNLAWRNKAGVTPPEPPPAVAHVAVEPKTPAAPVPARIEATVKPEAAAPPATLSPKPPEPLFPAVPTAPATTPPAVNQPEIPRQPAPTTMPAPVAAPIPVAPQPEAVPAAPPVTSAPAAPPVAAVVAPAPVPAPALPVTAAPQPAPPAVATPPKPKPKPPAAARPPVPPPPPPSLWNQLLGNTYYLSLAGVFVILLGLGAWAYQRRRSALAEFDKDTRKPEVRPIDVTQTRQPEPVAGQSGLGLPSQQQGSFLSDFTPSDFDVLDTDNDAIDPISEADVYLAYGRFSQAEELIRQAINENPFRDECKLKLLEVFYTAQNRVAFEKYAEELLEENKNNDQDFWARVLDMGRSLAPDNPMFGGVKTGMEQPAARVNAAPVEALTGSSGGAIDADLESLDFAFDLDDDVSFMTTAQETEPEEATLSFDVGESTLIPDAAPAEPEAISPPAATAPMAAEVGDVQEATADLTFDLGEFTVEPVEEPTEPAHEHTVVFDLGDFTVEPVLPVEEQPAVPAENTAASSPDAPAQEEDAGLAFQKPERFREDAATFDLGDFTVEPVLPVEEQPVVSAENTAASSPDAPAQEEDAGLAFDLGDFTVETVTETPATIDDDAASLEFDVSTLSEGGFRFAGVTQSVDEAPSPVQEEAGRTLEFTPVDTASTPQDGVDAESALISELLSTENKSGEKDSGFDMSTLIQPAPLPAAPAAPTSPSDDEFNFDMNFDMSNPLFSSQPGAAVDDDELESVIDLGDMDEPETKLDLAKAYIDMENHDAARLMLEEVLQQGNERQQQEAQAMLKQLG